MSTARAGAGAGEGSTHTPRLKDASVRQLSHAVAVVCLLCYATAAVFEVVNPRGASSWGYNSPLVNLFFVLAIFAFPVVGVLITHREPRNRIGWIMLTIGVIWGCSALAEGYVLYAVRTDPGSLPRPDVVAALSSWAWVPAIGLTGVFLILLFPDGRLPSPRWRGVGRLAAVGMVTSSSAVLFRAGPVEDTSVEGLTNPFGVEGLGPVLDVLMLATLALPICIVLSAASLVVRYRRSAGVARLQLKWLATAGTFMAGIYFPAVGATFSSGNLDRPPEWALVLQSAALMSFFVLPVAIGIAILKHRLYGIDVVISKSVVFGTLATFITGVYVVVVVGVGRLLGQADQPNLALSIAATAIVAVAFEPVRDRVQRFANRLVYGSRATPYEVLSDFADRMGGTYDAAELLPMMARTVGQGVGARHVGVWLAAGDGLELEATWPPDRSGPPEHEVVDALTHLEGDRVMAVRHRGELLGAITVVKPPGEALTPAEGRLLDDVSAQAGLVLRNVRLIEDLRGSRQRLVRTQDEERRRLERNLHDGAQQSLVAVALMIRMVRARLGVESRPAAETLDEAADQLASAIEELRALARGIHPAILSERGLGPAIRSLAERSPVPVVVHDRLEDRPPMELESTLYHVAAEALTNVAKHAHASAVEVTLSGGASNVALEVSDDGAGGADAGSGTGLLGLTDRVSVVEGTLLIDSPPGVGTRLLCTVPLATSTRPSTVVPAQPRTTQPLGAGQ